MGSIRSATQPHAVCVPYPAQGHITPMHKLAQLLHHRGFHITFVNTEYNHRRFLESRGPSSLDGLPDFRYETIPDGLPQTDVDVTQDTPSLCVSTRDTCLPYFRDLMKRLNINASSSGAPPVTCIVSDGSMTFTLDAAEEFGIPEALFWTTSACGYMAYLHYKDLASRGLFPLKDVGCLTNGFLDTPIDWIPGLKGIRLKDMPTFFRTTDADDMMVNYVIGIMDMASRASAIILNTFDDLERSVLESMAPMLPPVHTVGPLHLLEKKTHKSSTVTASMGSNLWKEDASCLGWLDTKAPGSVVYVNFGSITVMGNKQLIEFAWGLCGSNRDFLWVIRPDLVEGDSAVLPEEFHEQTKERALLTSWCPQEQVLCHPAVGGFLTHSGWNSTIESMSDGVPMLCWPFFSEQPTNCRYSCTEWGIGMEIDNDVKREEVADLIVELMGGDRGNEMRRRAREWKASAVAATQPGGSSSINMEKLVNDVLLSCRKL